MFIYSFTNNINGKKYIGQTNNIDQRYYKHRSLSNNITEESSLFHKKLNEYGFENFTFSIVEEVDDEKADERENFWILHFHTYAGENNSKGYNMTYGGRGSSGSLTFTNGTQRDRLSKEELDIIVKMLSQGKPFVEIQKKVNIGSPNLSGINSGRIYNNSKLKYPLHKYYKSDEECQEVVQLLLNTDLTLKEIAEKTNYSRCTIKKINTGALRPTLYHDYPIRKMGVHEHRANIIKKMLIEKRTNEYILENVKTSINTIRRINRGETHFDEKLNYPLR